MPNLLLLLFDSTSSYTLMPGAIGVELLCSWSNPVGLGCGLRLGYCFRFELTTLSAYLLDMTSFEAKLEKLKARSLLNFGSSCTEFACVRFVKFLPKFN